MKPRVLLAQRATIESYPPVLNQAHLLEKFGDVTILDYGSMNSPEFLTSPDLRRVRISSGGSNQPLSRTARLRSALAYRKEFFTQVQKGYDVVIAYEPEAAALLLSDRVRRS